MNEEENLELKKAQLMYLIKSAERISEEIEALLRADPHAALKAAHDAGKRIAVASLGLENWDITSSPTWLNTVRYKIVPDDEIDNREIAMFGVFFRAEFTRCALTGKITAEVVNNATLGT
jgi:hypothetical protein